MMVSLPMARQVILQRVRIDAPPGLAQHHDSEPPGVTFTRVAMTQQPHSFTVARTLDEPLNEP